MFRFTILLLLLFLTACNSMPYKEAEKNLKSHNDVAHWLESNFTFDYSRQRSVIKTLRREGPEGVTLYSPEQVYQKGGYCADAANFAFQNLKRINPAYNPRFVFIVNSEGRPNHWVTAFDYQGKLWIIDYGTGGKWFAMQGLHGPYNNLSEYELFLSSLDMPGFGVGSVYFRNFPGTIME